MCTKIQDVIMSHFEYKLLHQHIPVINLYTARGILMCVHDCNRKLCNTRILSYNKKIKKNGHITPYNKEMT